MESSIQNKPRIIQANSYVLWECATLLPPFRWWWMKYSKRKIKGNLIIVYMDDILGFSKTINGLKEIEWIVLEKAWDHDLFFKAKKCEFQKQKTEYLGLVVQEGKLAMDSAKLKKILEWPTPKTVKEVWSFLGFGNFYQWFIKSFSHLAHPLNDLLKKNKESIWSKECQDSFDLLKKQFTEGPMLMMPDHTRPFQIQVNSSLFATEGFLPKWIQMEIITHAHICLKAWPRNKGTTIQEIENYWQ